MSENIEFFQRKHPKKHGTYTYNPAKSSMSHDCKFLYCYNGISSGKRKNSSVERWQANNFIQAINRSALQGIQRKDGPGIRLVQF
jgi:hypothetical protein